MTREIVQEVWDDNELSARMIEYLLDTKSIRLASRPAPIELVQLNDPVIRYMNAQQTVCRYQPLPRGNGRFAIYGSVDGFDEWYHVGWIEQS